MLMTFLSGCDAIPPEYEKYWVQLQKEWAAMLTVLTGGKAPGAQASPKPSEAPNPVAEDFSSQNARNAKSNAELLHEVFVVVFIREPKDRGEFGSLVDSMNQGASIEGMYNGFTHSSDYRRLELANAGASPEALQAFGEELAILEAELPTPVEFDAQAAPVDKPHADGVNVIEYGKAPQSGTRVDIKALSDKYTKQFVGASIYTLKRILGDEALRVITVKKEYPEKLALWYSKWVVHMAARGVDYGIALRNKPDEQFHYKWALSAGEDRVKWEVLNRVHRLLNEANRQKQ